MGLTFLLWKARIHLFGIEMFDKYMRKKYCHKGFHKLYHGSIGQGNSKRMTWVHYLKCRHCNYIFFASENDKKRYLRMTGRERSAFRSLLSGYKDEAFNKTGRSVWKEASSRASEGISSSKK